MERCPAEHTGLGVGTQLGLVVAKALVVASGEPELSSTELAARVGRGERSAIGVSRLRPRRSAGGRGKVARRSGLAAVAHVPLPDEWRVVLFTPPVANRWHGDYERRAFATASAGDPDALRRLAEDEMLPAARSGDLDAFGEAVYAFNRKDGEPFSVVQGACTPRRKSRTSSPTCGRVAFAGSARVRGGRPCSLLPPTATPLCHRHCDSAVACRRSFRGFPPGTPFTATSPPEPASPQTRAVPRRE